MDEQTYTEGPRAFTIKGDDHRGVVVTIAILFICYALMIAGMRMAARLRTIGIDDYLAIAATVLSIAQFATVIGAVSHLFGTSYEKYQDKDATEVARTLRASDILLLVSLTVAKCAAIWLCRRLFSIIQKAPRILCDTTMGLSVLWCVSSIVIVSANCDPEAAIGRGQGTCPGLVKRWTIIGTLDALLECMIVALSVVVVWPLRMSVKRRLQAMTCFFLRLPIIVLIALHIHYLDNSTRERNKGVAFTMPIIMRQAQLLFSLFSASIPALNQYLRRFQTTSSSTFGYRPDAYGGHSYGLKSITVAGRNNHSRNDNYKSDTFSSNRHGNYKATIDVREGDNSQDEVSVGRHNSEDMIIRKDIVYEVSYSQRDGAKRDRVIDRTPRS